MDLMQILATNYSLNIQTIEKTKYGSGNTYIIKTNKKKYIAKYQDRIDFITIYEQVQQTLNNNNLLQSKIIKTNNDLLMAEKKIVLYEFIEGEIYKELDDTKLNNALLYMRKYHEMLQLVPIHEKMLFEINYFDQAHKLPFIINELPKIINNLEIEKDIILKAINILSTNYDTLTSTRKLIHSDLGPDNFIFRNDEVISIIDFTPLFHHELYALSHFVYWNYLYSNDNISYQKILNYLRIYNQRKEENIFYLLLIQASLFRIVAPLLTLKSKNIYDYSRLNRRFTILRNLLSLKKL